MNDRKALVAFFSDSRSCRTIAEALSDKLSPTHIVSKAEIKPKRKRRKLTWFFLSLIPGSQVRLLPTETVVAEYHQICLVVPKWNLNCPPVTAYLRKITGIAGKHVAIFLVHRGPKYLRYMKSLQDSLDRRGANVYFSAGLRPQEIFDGTMKKLMDKFLSELPPGIVGEEKVRKARFGSECRHRPAYWGIVNLAWKGKPLGHIDIWRCAECGEIDATGRGHSIRSEIISNRTPGKWLLLACVEEKSVGWQLVRAAAGENILCGCSATEPQMFLVPQQGSYVARPMGGRRLTHYMYDLVELRNSSVDLAELEQFAS